MNIPKLNHRTETVTKATKFYACYRDFAFLTAPDAFLLYRAKNNTLHSVQVGYVLSIVAYKPWDYTCTSS